MFNAIYMYIYAVQDHNYCIQSSSHVLKYQLLRAQESLQLARRTLYNIRRREKRAKHTISSLLEKLRQMKLMSEECEKRLQNYSGLYI